MLDVALIPYASGLGAGKLGSEMGPKVLHDWGLAKLLTNDECKVNWLLDILSLSPESQNNEVNKNGVADRESVISMVAEHCEKLSCQVADALLARKFPVTIGGDHTMAIGTWSGVAKGLHLEQKLGLIWIDAHMDAHTKTTSHSGNFHGMPISYLLGQGPGDPLARVTDYQPIIAPHKLCLIGTRSFEKEEAEFLEKIGAVVFSMREVRKQGLEAVMQQALKIVTTNTGGFGISVDIDAFDPKIAPGTGSLATGGLFVDEFINACNNALPGYKKLLVAMEVAEYNPALDKSQITLELIRKIIATILK